ncbi:MAG: hypothetical protein GY906_23105 [bacterium]|nr:hypothetical protein [bacterium]
MNKAQRLLSDSAKRRTSAIFARDCGHTLAAQDALTAHRMAKQFSNEANRVYGWSIWDARGLERRAFHYMRRVAQFMERDRRNAD